MSRVKETIKLNESQNEELRVPCAKCSIETRHKVMQSVDVDGAALDWDYQYANKFQIVQCQGCDSISFRKWHSNSEDHSRDFERDEYYPAEVVEIYPIRVVGRHKLRQDHFLPFEVKRIYDETHAALCNELPILAGIGIRALIETICKQKKATGKSLEQKIDNLVALGVLTQKGSEILHSMRILGNEAAHEVKPHSEETLNLAMDVVEHLLADVYILPATTKNLPKRT